MMKFVIWLIGEGLLLRICFRPLSMVMDSRRFYQNKEFNGALLDTACILAAMILVGVLAYLT